MKRKIFPAAILFFGIGVICPAEAQGILTGNQALTKPPVFATPYQNNLALTVNRAPLSSLAGRDSLVPSVVRCCGLQDEQPLSFPAVAVPAIGIGYGVIALHHSAPWDLNISTKNEIREDHPRFATHADNYLQWSPAAAVIGLNLAGLRGKHCFQDELQIYGVSMIVMAGTVFGLKHMTHEERPDHSGFDSFPSGHAATAFAAAEWLRAEYAQRSPWIGIAGYTVATATGVLRVYNNRHWVSDVVAGAAIGFLSTRMAIAVSPWIQRHVLHTRTRP